MLNNRFLLTPCSTIIMKEHKLIEKMNIPNKFYLNQGVDFI